MSTNYAEKGMNSSAPPAPSRSVMVELLSSISEILSCANSKAHRLDGVADNVTGPTPEPQPGSGSKEISTQRCLLDEVANLRSQVIELDSRLGRTLERLSSTIG